MKDLKKRHTALNKLDSNSMSIRATINKWGYTFNLKYYGQPRKDVCFGSCNFWANKNDGYWGEDDAIERLKADICKSIDDQRKVIVRELKKAGVYEPSEL